MGIYDRWILPGLIAWTMRNDELAAYRRRLVPLARGQVLEIGIGSGLNLPHYATEVEGIIGLDRRRHCSGGRSGSPRDRIGRFISFRARPRGFRFATAPSTRW